MITIWSYTGSPAAHGRGRGMFSCKASAGLADKILMLGNKSARTSARILTVKLLGLVSIRAIWHACQAQEESPRRLLSQGGSQALLRSSSASQYTGTCNLRLPLDEAGRQTEHPSVPVSLHPPRSL